MKCPYCGVQDSRVLDSRAAREIAAGEIGEPMLERLRRIDEVAYVRFASVYRRFPDFETYKTEFEEMLLQKRESTPREAGKREAPDHD